MLVERSTLHQSAVGSLFSLLNKSQSADAPSFEQHFSQSVDAVSRREPTTRRQGQDATDQDVTASRPRAEPRRKDDKGRSDTTVAASEPTSPASSQPSRAKESSGSTERVADKASTSADASAERRTPAQGDRSSAEPAPQTQAVDVSPQARTKVAMLKELVTGGRAVAVSPVFVEPQVAEVAPLAAELAESKAAGAPRPALADADPLPVEPVAVAGQGQVAAATSAAASQPTAQQTPRRTAASSFRQAASDGASAAATAARLQSAEKSAVDAVTASPKAAEPTAVASHAKPQALQAPILSADVVTVQVVTAPAAAESATGHVATETPGVGKVAADTSVMRAGGLKAAPEAQPGAASGADEQIERIVHVMRASISRGGSRVNMRLDPPELGQLRIQMQLRNGDLTARFETQTEAARNWVYSQLGSLREALAGQNIRLIQASVESRDPGNDAPWGGQSGHPDSFTGGHEAGGDQTRQHGHAPHDEAATAESDVLWWNPAPAEDNEVNLMV